MKPSGRYMAGFGEAGEPPGWDLAIGEVTGYRWWNAYGGPNAPAGAAVRLAGHFAPWSPGPNRAECLCPPAALHFFARQGLSGSVRIPWTIDPGSVGGHESPPPAQGCGCGFWAYWDPDNAANPLPPFAPVAVFGVIRASGRVIIGERGFRAERAEILAVTVTGWRRLACTCDRCADEVRGWKAAVSAMISKEYGIPALGSREELVRRFPPDALYGPAAGPQEPERKEHAPQAVPRKPSGRWRFR